MQRFGFAATLGLILLGTAGAASARAETAPPVDYAKAESWLCRPGHMEPCKTDLSATIVAADGSLTRETWRTAAWSKIDCFYVYPTASTDMAPNSDLIPGTRPREEIPVVQQQFARFGSICRLFAPMYRSTTVPQMRGQVPPGDRNLAYQDVRAAWNHYLAHDNKGRGVILIGHSQGTGHLKRLIAEEIDGKPAQKLLVSAMLAGGNVEVARGSDRGGDFQSIPLCRNASQTGCVVAWVTFRDNLPPGEKAWLGKPSAPDRQVACTNPAALGGGKAVLKPYFFATFPLLPGEPAQKPWTSSGAAVTTPWVTTPGLVSAECRDNGIGSYLAISVYADPADARVDEIKGDIMPNGQIMAEWGLHMIDTDVTLGSLIDVAAEQSKAWKRR